jgi:osmotically-inducible protein OsmY
MRPDNFEMTRHSYRLPDTPGAELSDEQLEAAVTVKLRRDPLIDSSAIQVDSTDHVITLTGTQPLLIARDRAAYLAETVRGVRQVTNDIDVVTGRDVDGERLESDIMYALLTDPATERNEFTVEASDTGNVILRGSVDSGAERSIAEKVIKSIVGVRSVIDEVELRPAVDRPDEEILADVQRVLQWDAYVDSTNIQVDVHDGVVTLSGNVRSPAEKRRSVGLSWVSGARHVNVVPLRIGSWQQHPARARGVGTKTKLESDASLAEAIRFALARDPRVSSADIDVKVQNHVVTLTGTADDLRAKRLAARTPYGIIGVRSVRDRLRVPEARAFDDDEIGRRVQRALDRNSATTDDAIIVLVRDGAVTLQGVADDRYTRTIAEDLAASVRGVRSISNKLRADVGAKRLFYDPYVDANSAIDHNASKGGIDKLADIVSDADLILEDVRRELWWSPFVDERDIQISAEAAVVTLRGTVDSEAERRAAIEKALEGGAVSVKDRLVVAEEED